jgi:hypothetical protein
MNTDIWTFLLELVKILVPAAIIFAVTYTMLNLFFNKEYEKRLLEVRAKNVEMLTPVRLQAYERLVLLLERISPNSLIMRVNKPGMSAAQFKAELIVTINEEYTHNLSQQIYVSLQSWTLIKAVKEETINIINTTFTHMDPNATSLDLAKGIFEVVIRNDEIPTQKAIDFLKREFRLVFEQ